MIDDNANERAISRRSDIVGRLALWSISATLILLPLSALMTTLWLVAPFGSSPAFATALRGILGATLVAGGAAFIVLFVFHRLLVPDRDTQFRSLSEASLRVHVGLTAFNDEICIGDAVRDFKSVSQVSRLVVVDNNSRDGTVQAAIDAGADDVIIETTPGYGACCMRALKEAARDSDVVVLCEGDMTFAANDVKKLIAYLENCDLTLGTRATQELRMRGTQMDWLINPANQVVAKLVQVRFWGTRLTDVGCTYRAMRTDAYYRLEPHLSVHGNHFSPHMFIEALKLRMRVIEVPVVFRKRAGLSKGVGSNKVKAAVVATRMLALLYRA